MNKVVLILGLSIPFNLSASPTRCITEVLYQEARGANAEEMAMVGNSIINQHTRTNRPICKVTAKGYQNKRPPTKERLLYEHIARGIMSGAIPDLTKGADHFNEGKKPRWPGKITRVTKHFVFYRLASVR